MDSYDVAATIIIASMVLFLLTGAAILLIIVGHNRRNRYRADLAELKVLHAQEVRAVEREVTQHTLVEVGRELHDNIGQLLTVARMGVNELIRSSPEPQRAQHVKETLDTTISEVRGLSRTLNTDKWNDRALADVLKEECERVQRLGGMEMVLSTDGAADASSADQRLVLFRIFQEVVNNAVKHAGASRMDITLSAAAPLRLVMRDNGSGFDPSALSASGKGQGLGNIRRRAELIGMTCEVRSAPGEGTTITLQE